MYIHVHVHEHKVCFLVGGREEGEGKTLTCVPMFSVGAEVSQTNTSELKFLFEGHEEFSTIPSFAVLPAMVRHCCPACSG